MKHITLRSSLRKGIVEPSLTHAEVDTHIAAFLARGGKVQIIPPAETGEAPITHGGSKRAKYSTIKAKKELLDF